MSKLFVLDTCAVISYYSPLFQEQISISQKSLSIIKKAFTYGDINVIVPSIVFIELYELFFKTEEKAKQIYYEIFTPIKNAYNFEIRPFDKETLLEFIKIDDLLEEERFDNHDKQILATAMVMDCPLITSDSKIKAYNKRKMVIPSIFD